MLMPYRDEAVDITKEHSSETKTSKHSMGETPSDKFSLRRTLLGHAAGEVSVANDVDTALRVNVRLAGLGQGTVASHLGSKVNDDRATLHAANHGLSDELGGGLVGDEGGGDDDVNLLGLSGEQIHLSGDELGTHSLGVATDTVAVFLDGHLEELSAHALNLLLDRRSGVECANDGAQGPGNANRSKTSHTCPTQRDAKTTSVAGTEEATRAIEKGEMQHTGTDDEDLGGENLAGSRGLAVEESGHNRSSLHNSAIARQVALGAQSCNAVNNTRPS